MMLGMNFYRFHRPVILLLSVLIVAGTVHTTRSSTWCPPAAPCEPSHEGTTSLPLLEVVQGNLPPPAPNQLRAEHCDSDRAEEPIEGGCWVRTKTKPPCPAGKQWEYEGACYVPALDRKPRPGVAVP